MGTSLVCVTGTVGIDRQGHRCRNHNRVHPGGAYGVVDVAAVVVGDAVAVVVVAVGAAVASCVDAWPAGGLVMSGTSSSSGRCRRTAERHGWGTAHWEVAPRTPVVA